MPVITAIAPQDGPLRLARLRLDDAVRAFADPVPEMGGSSVRWADPLYTRLREALCSAGLPALAVSAQRVRC